MGNFVRDYGTGNDIPNPPQFINFNTPDAIPSSASRPSTRPASFIRSSTRELPPREPVGPAEDEPSVNTAGIGAGGSRHSMALDPASLPGQDSRPRSGSSAVNGQQPYLNGGSSSARPDPSPEPSSNRTSVHRKPTMSAQAPATVPSQRVPHDPMAEPIDPNAETFIKVGTNAYRVDLSRDPQQQSPLPAVQRSAPASPVKPSTTAKKQDGPIDPLQKQLLELQNAVSSNGSMRRNTLQRHSIGGGLKPASPVPPPSSTAPKSLSPPGPLPVQTNRSPSPSRDYRNSADLVVGAHPSAPASSRPASPNPPTAAFMLPPGHQAQPPGTEGITEVLADYQQSLPGERKSISRSNSFNRPASAQAHGHNPQRSAASINIPIQGSNANQAQDLHRPNSRMGHVGIGAYGGSRSNSPLPQSRGPSPAPIAPSAPFVPPTGRKSLVTPAQNIVRAPSPNSVGISLDPNGRVLHDELAQGYQPQAQAHRQSQPPQQRPPSQTQQPTYHPPPAPSPQQQPVQRRSSYVPSASNIPPPAPPQMFAVTPPPITPANAYQAPAPAQPTYAPPPANHPTYTPPSQLLYQQQQPAAPQQPAYQQPPQQPVNAYGQPGRNGSAMGNYYEPPQQQYPTQRQPATTQPPYQPPAQQQWNSSPAVHRTPSPQPPPQPTTEDGSTILFYGKCYMPLPRSFRLTSA